MRWILAAAIALLLLLTVVACGGAASHATNPQSPAPTNPAPSPQPQPNSPLPPSASSSHVVLVMEENHSYLEVAGNPEMPYLNSLAQQYSLATNYFASAHPSLPNYFMLTTGQTITFDDNFSGTVDADNVARELTAAGKTWKVYAEGLPSVGYLGGDTGAYVKRHNPFAYFTDVVNSPTVAANLVPFSQFATDLSGGTLPNFSFVVPDLNDDGHDGTLAAADTWLQTNIGPLLANAQFQQDGILIVTFDEGAAIDILNGGGQVATVVVGPKVKRGYRSTTFYQHPSTLRQILGSLGITVYPGAASTAPSMGEFFQ